MVGQNTLSERIGFRMRRDTFTYLCQELRNEIKKEDTIFRTDFTLWRLSTDGDYCTIGHLFGVGKGILCVIVHEVCEAIV